MHSHTRHASRRLRVLAVVLALTLALSATPASAATAIYTVTAKKVNVRALPDTDAEILSVVRQGSELTLLEATDDGWLKVSVGGTVGYVSAEYATLSSVLSGGGTLSGVVTTDKLYVRAEASSNGKTLDLVRKGTVLTITALTGDWFQVSYNGSTGYVASAYVRLTGGSGAAPIVAPTAVPTPVPTAAPTATPVPASATLKEGSRGDAVKALQQKLIALGYLSGTADGAYGTGTKNAVRAFQSANRLSADGTAGPLTLTAIDAAYAALTPSVTPAPAISDAILKKGDKGESVRALQKYLIQLGYLTGEADGVYGSGTKNAVRAFQAANGLSADGAAGEKTLLAIQAAISAVSTATTLREGDKGDAVKILQQKLIALGNLSSSADGIFGSSTKAAVSAFQSAHSLTATGVADAATLSAIDKAYQSGTPGGSTIIAPGKVDDGSVTIKPGTSPSNYPTLKYGDSGSNVTILQNRLKDLGYFNGTVGGNFGLLTQTAVTAFQSAAGLTVDGVVGSGTWAALYDNKAPTAPSTTLKEGDKSDDVKAMQARLIELGYLTGKADGVFGAKTKAAVQAFQTKISYTADGTAGPQTLAALYAESAPKATDVIVAPTVTPTTPITIVPAPRVARDTDFEKGAQLVALAKKYLGCTYIYAHQAPPYFDCSGLTYYCYKQFGYTLKRTAYAQGYDDTYPKIEKISDLQIGDLIYFNTNETDSDLSDHAAIYIGDGNFIHASSSSGYVLIQSLSTKFYKEHFSWGRRVFNQQ